MHMLYIVEFFSKLLSQAAVKCCLLAGGAALNLANYFKRSSSITLLKKANTAKKPPKISPTRKLFKGKGDETQVNGFLL